MSITPKPPQIIPYLFYNDIGAALDFLCGVFGFKEEMRTGTPSGGMHGEASFQGQLVMMGQGSLRAPHDVGAATMGVFVYLDDVTSTTRSPKRQAQKSSTRRRMSSTAEPTRRSIPRVIPGSSQRRRRASPACRAPVGAGEGGAAGAAHGTTPLSPTLPRSA